MSTFKVNRGSVITAICGVLAALPDFNLVKPYEGEVYRYGKQEQIKSETFGAEVNLQSPFALVISRGRPVVEKRSGNRSKKLRHEISVYIGMTNTHNFNSTTVPPIFSVLAKCAETLDGLSLGLDGAGVLELIDDGEFLVQTDLYTVYDQRYYQHEVAY
jgi:hypothetical protein